MEFNIYMVDMSALDIDSRADETSLVGCPYCGKPIKQRVIRRSGDSVEIQCQNCSKEKIWHNGTFRLEVFTLESKRTRPPDKKIPGRYSLYGSNSEGPVNRIFFTFTEIDIRKGDKIILSYKRVPKGVINRIWSGVYSDMPTILGNIRTGVIYRI